MSLHRPLHDREAEPRAADPARDERLEEPLAQLIGNPRAVVRDPEQHGQVGRHAAGKFGRRDAAHRHVDLGPSVRGLQRVEHQVHDDAVDQVLVALDPRRPPGEDDARMGGTVGMLLHEIDGGPRNRLDLDGLGVRHANP